MFKKNRSALSNGISGLPDVDFSVPPTNNDILSFDSTTSKWLPKPPITPSQATGISTYTIELSRWGITQGLPSKRIEVINSVSVNCYSNADYLKAYNNIIGINNAMAWAYSNGYRKVIVPLGDYSVCYSRISDNDKENYITIDYSNFILDLNGATFKVMFDSVKRSPYDKMKSGSAWVVNTAEPYMLSTPNAKAVFIIRDCDFTELKNGILIGDKIDRDFTLQLEKARETTTGIAAGGNCRYINVENMDVSFFMGDGITVSFGTNAQVKTGYDMGWALGDLMNNTTPQSSPITSTATTGGSLPAETYYVSYSWVNASGQTLTSPEATVTTTGTTSRITVTIPALPANITSANIYIGTTAGAGMKQNATPVTTTSYVQTAVLAVGAAKPTLNTVDGTPIPSTTQCRSDFIAVDGSTPHFLHGYGATQGMTALKNKKYSVYFYDINHTYITKETLFALQDFTTTKLTNYVKLVVEESALDPAIVDVTTGGWQMILKTGIYGSYLTYQNNYIHHNHRGGMSQTLNETFVINNHFYNNGEVFDYENNLPGFEQPNGQPFLTRYHINVEDTQGFNMHIIGNRFESGRIGIAIRSHSCIIKDNWFKDCIGVILYRQHYAIVKDNYFDNAGFNTHPYNSSYNSYTDYIRYWDIEGNTIDGDFSIKGTATVKSVSNNNITGSVIIESEVEVFKNNKFRVEKDVGFSEQVTLKTVSNIEGCTFEKKSMSTVNNSITFESAQLLNCSFKNVKVQVKDVTLANCIVNDSGFNVKVGSFKLDNCKVNHGTYLLLNNYAILPENSALINVVETTNPVNVELKNCEVVSTSAQSIFASSGNTPLSNANLRLENTKINKQLNNKMGIGIFNGQLNFINSIISSDVAVPNITPNVSLNHRFSDCTFTNVSFTVKTSDIQYSQSDIGLLARPLSGTGVPAMIPSKVGQEYYDLTNKKLYKAFGTSASTDWVVMN